MGRKKTALVNKQQTLQSDLYNLMVVFFTHFNKRLTQCEKKKAALSFMDDNFDDNWEEEEEQVNPDDSLYVNLGNNIDSEDYPSKKVISIATPEQIDSMVDRFKKKRAVKNQHSQGGTLTRNGNYVSNFAPIKEMEIKSRERKDMQRTNNRIEFKHVADFVHLFLLKKLEFSQDQNKHEIPRKMIVEMYEAWCKMKNRKILVHKPSTLHMSITNEIKIAFPQVYVQSRMYKGLKFKDSINDNPPNEYLNIQNMNGSSTNFNSSSNSNTNGNINGNMKVNLSGSNGNRNFSNGNNRDKNKVSSQEDYYVLKEQIESYSDKDREQL